MDLDAVSRVEDVADCLTIAEGLVGHCSLLLVLGVCKSNQEFTSVESIEIIVSIGFSVGMVPNLGVFPCLVDLSNLLVERRLGVEVVPEHFSVLRVITTSVVLLRPVVHEWDSSAGH